MRMRNTELPWEFENPVARPLSPFQRVRLMVKFTALTCAMNTILGGREPSYCWQDVKPDFGKGVEEHPARPKPWQFQQGKYTRRTTNNGHTQVHGNKRVEYNGNSQASLVFAEVEGQWKLREIRKRRHTLRPSL